MKPDYTGAEEAIENAENLGDQLTDEEKAALEDLKKDLEDLKNDPTSNFKDDQTAIDEIKDKAQEIIDAHATCEHVWGAPVLDKAPTATEQGEYTETCGKCGETRITKVDRANYGSFDEAVDKLEDALANNKDLTDEAKAKIESALEIADNFNKNLPADATTADGEVITGGQNAIDNVVNSFNEILNGIENGTLVKPDFGGYESSREEYDGLVNQYGDKIKDGVAEDVAEIDGKVEDVRNDKNATEYADQDKVDDAKDDLDEIIEGINNGVLRDPDYSEVENKLAEANNADNLNDDTQSKIEAIEKELEALKNDPSTNARDDQEAVNNLKDRIDTILDNIASNKAIAPDFTEWNIAEDAYDALDKTGVKEAIIKEATNLKNRINALENNPEANVADHQAVINAATARLNEIIAGITDASLIKPDYSGADEAINKAEGGFDGGKLSAEDKMAVDELKAELDKIKNDPNSNKRDDQGAIDSIKDAVNVIVNKYNSCASGSHSYTEKVVPADRENKGYTVHTCSVCGKSFRDNYVNALGHVEIVIPAKDATCSEVGNTEGSACAICGKVIVPTQQIPMLKHTDNNDDGTCDICHKGGLYDGCTCLCHNDHWFWHIIYLIVRIIWIVFRIHPTCACGAVHYR